mgnify:CR=1 FL=1
MNKEIILKEITLKAVRSSGAGGQNVNKVSSKVILNFKIESSFAFSEEEKILIIKNLNRKISQDGFLQIYSDADRSQIKNKETVIKRLFKILNNALKIPKERKITQIPEEVKEHRLKQKKNLSIVKQHRKKPEI